LDKIIRGKIFRLLNKGSVWALKGELVMRRTAIFCFVIIGFKALESVELQIGRAHVNWQCINEKYNDFIAEGVRKCLDLRRKKNALDNLYEI
jgi:hypothetical protein